MIDYFLSIDTFEQQYVVLKGILKLPRLKDHVHTIGIEKSLKNNDIYKHKCIENIKKVYKEAGKCDDQQQFKDIIVAAMVSTPWGFTNNSRISTMTSTPINKPSDHK